VSELLLFVDLVPNGLHGRDGIGIEDGPRVTVTSNKDNICWNKNAAPAIAILTARREVRIVELDVCTPTASMFGLDIYMPTASMFGLDIYTPAAAMFGLDSYTPTAAMFGLEFFRGVLFFNSDEGLGRNVSQDREEFK
jgi:hypothetical protein